MNSSYWMDRRYTYSPSGLLLEAGDKARPSEGRRYDYDNQLRLTCERTVSNNGGYDPCDESSPYTLGLFSYFDGESPLAAPDHRETAFLRGQTYTSPSTERTATRTNPIG